MVVSRGGIVASESPLASQAGVRILESGGNAVDAAIATNAMMGVVEPMMNGIGGDLFAIVYDAKANKLYGLNASGWAPKGLTIAYLDKQGIKSMPQKGINSVTVPGAVDGWQKLADKFGRKKLGDDLAPAIKTARDGFPVPEWDALYWADEVDYLHGDGAATATYLPNDRPPKLGEIFRNPDLATSLEAIATHGRDAYYKGEIATKLIEGMKRHNGTMTAQDLSEYSAEWVEPLSTTYRDWTVFELPPNGQGIAALEMLNIMEKFPLGDKDWGFGSPKALHTMIEAKKLAYTDLAKYIGDPRGQKLPVKTLTLEGMGRPARQTDRSRARQLRREGRRPAAWLRNHLPHRRRSRRQYGFADPEQLRRLRLRCRRAGHGLRAAKSRRPVLARPVLAQRLGRPQAPAPHDHPGLRAARRRSNRLRHHGRLEPGSSPRPIRRRRRRFQNEHSSRAGSAALFEIHLHRLRPVHREPLSAERRATNSPAWGTRSR